MVTQIQLESVLAQLTTLAAQVQAMMQSLPVHDEKALANPLVVTVVERLDLKPALPLLTLENNPDKWAACLSYLILPNDKGAFGTVEAIETKYSFTDADKEHLEKLFWLRNQLLTKELSLNMVCDQRHVSEAEQALFTQLAKLKKLK